MTAHIGDHVHTLDDPNADLVIDAVAEQGCDSAWYSTHDRDGRRHYVSAEDTVPHGRHRAYEWPPVTGQLPTGPAAELPVELAAPVRWWRTDQAHQLACRLGDFLDCLTAFFAVLLLVVIGSLVVLLTAAIFWQIQPALAVGIGVAGVVLVGLAVYLLATREPAPKAASWPN